MTGFKSSSMLPSPVKGIKVEAIDHLGYDEIKELIAPLREIFSATLEVDKVPRISHIYTSWIPADYPQGSIPVYTMFPDCANASLDPLTEAVHALPPGLSPLMLQAYLKWNNCDMSAFTYLPFLRAALSPFGAKVEWIVIHPKAQHILHWSWVPDPTELPNHSVFLITTKQGKEFIADFTQEQFDYFENWLLHKDAYLRQRSSTGMYRITDQLDFDAIAASCAMVYSFGRTAERIRDAYKHFDWSVLDGMQAEQLAARVRLGVAEVFARTWL